MSDEIRIIESLDEFRRLVENLYQQIETAREKRRGEYLALGRPVPDRIPFEDLDLSPHMHEMLSVQKTLQWRAHNHRLDSAAPKARVVAIAGVCEFIKNEYLGRFWESYSRLIGWGADQTVYNWLWESGFREEGIKLIISSSGRREFVQSLVLESGIPRRRTGDIIDFFVIYYRYLRKYEDIEDLMERLAEGSLILPALSGSERMRLMEICRNASDYSHTFALVVQKLNRVFDFIEESFEIVSRNIGEYADLIYEKTGIHPLEILRDSDQLERLYGRLLGFVTPARLRRILATLSPGTSVHLPSGKTISAGRYRFLQYGEHMIGGTSFICVPSPGLGLDALSRLRYDELIDIDGSLLLKCRKKLKVSIGGYERYGVVHWFYTKSAGVPQSEGAVFFSEIPPAVHLVIRDEDGRLLAEKEPDTGFSSSLSLGYFGNHEQHRHGLKVDIHRFRLHSSPLAMQRLSFETDNPEDKPLIFSVDRSGSTALEERYIRIRSPRPGTVIVKAVHFDTHQEVTVGGKPIRSSVQLEPVMLFSPVQQWQISPVKKGRSIDFGHHYLALFIAEGISVDSIHLDNLTITGRGESGQYQTLSLECSERRLPCSVEVSHGDAECYWRFERSSEYTLNISRVERGDYGGIRVGEKESRRAEDFALILAPVPDQEVRGSLIWSIVVNDGMPALTRFEAGPAGEVSPRGLEFKPEEFTRLVEPALEGSLSGILRVEVSLGTAGRTLATDRIWLFPDLEVEMKQIFREGEPVQAVVNCGPRRMAVDLRDSNGNREAVLDLRQEDGRWRRYPREYRGEIVLDGTPIRWDFKAVPQVAGCRLGSKIRGRTEMLRNMLRRELKDYDVLTVPGVQTTPVLTVDDRAFEGGFETDGDIFVYGLENLGNLGKSKISITVKTKHCQWSFDILYRLMVSHVGIHENLINDTVFGEVSFTGPPNSGLFFVICDQQEGASDRWGSGLFSSTQDEPSEKRSISIRLDSPPIPGKKYRVRLFLLSDVRNKRPGTEYGESWTVWLQEDAGSIDVQPVLAAVQTEMDRGNYFQARSLLGSIKMLATDEERVGLKELERKIEFMLCRKKICSIIGQARRILKKEYAMEI